ncbi:MAG: XRE family transcriptional regulator [Rhodobacteraceae bacterium]|nr:MAG: XRE family transcriptional regulator [Paracoccaceae bacterium]
MLNINAQWIKDQLDAGNGTRQGLAAALGVHRATISKITSGDRQIKGSEIPLIAEYFGVDESADVRRKSEDILSCLPSDGEDHSASLLRLVDRLSQLTDAELDYLTVAAEGLVARRSLPKDEE